MKPYAHKSIAMLALLSASAIVSNCADGGVGTVALLEAA